MAATEPDGIEVLENGRVSIVGSVAGVIDDGEGAYGTLITSGEVRFAIPGNSSAPRVRCTGELAELRHGCPSAATTGRVVGICWRPAILHEVSDRSYEIVGYAPGHQVRSTADIPGGEASTWAFEVTIRAGH